MVIKNEIINILRSNNERLKCFTLKDKKILDKYTIDTNDTNLIHIFLFNENSEPKKLNSVTSYKFFNNNYNYLVVKQLLDYKGNNYFEMYYWLGNECKVKNNFVIVYFTTILSYELNVTKMYRETSGKESDYFKNLFTP